MARQSGAGCFRTRRMRLMERGKCSKHQAHVCLHVHNYCRTAVFSCWTAGHEATEGAAGLQTLAGVKYRSGSAGRLLAVWGSGLAGGCGDVMVTRASERE
jgi:hypothetical protein